MNGFPIVKAGTVFNKFKGVIDRSKLVLVKESVLIRFPTRVNTMVLDLTKLAPNEDMIFPAGEVLISVDKPVIVKTKFLRNFNNQLQIGDNTKRKALVNHAYQLMCQALGISPSLYIDVDDSNVIKHCGLGSSGATLGAVCSSINELFGSPIKSLDLLKYITNNYGEETTDGEKDLIQSVASIGGSISTGLFDGGIQVITGNATPIMSCNYNGKVIIGVPRDYNPLTAKEQIELEDKYIFNNPPTQDENTAISLKYREMTAYKMLNHALPLLIGGDISGVSEMAYDFNFKSGGIKMHNWLYPRMSEIADNIINLYQQGKCDSIGKSSVGPAFYALVSNEADQEICAELFNKQNLDTSIISVCNGKYEVQTKYSEV